MGGGRDKRKKQKERKEGPKPGKGVEKTEKHTKRNEDKKARRTDRKLEGDEDDIDAILAKMALEEKSQKAVQVQTDCPPPSARRTSEIILFGGECSDVSTEKVYVYNDLYRFSCDKQRWSKVTSPNSPPARSAHQACIYKTFLYVFGGEFTSPNQQRFHHYKDLWRLDLESNEWEQLTLKGAPTARSGHRMTTYKHRIILFGGFYDNGREVKYYNDLWELDLNELRWSAVGDIASSFPSPRGGFQMLVHGDLLFLYGGYSKAKDDEDEDLEHGKTCDDMWVLELTNYSWERIKRQGLAPNARASFAMVGHKGRAFLFGGVSDREAKGGEDLSSEFHNDLYQFNLTNRRWYAAELKPPTKQAAQPAEEQAAASQGSGSALAGTSGGAVAETAAESIQAGLSREMQAVQAAAGGPQSSALHRAATRIQASFRGYVVRKAYKTYRLGGAVSEILYSPAGFGLDMSVRNAPKPRARISPLTCVVGNTLWLLGGVVEVGEKEITLDDMWSLDLAKLDGWKLARENTVGEDMFKAGSSSSWEEDGDEDDSGSESD